jgi:surface carbohydrate biosynthesis protein
MIGFHRRIISIKIKIVALFLGFFVRYKFKKLAGLLLNYNIAQIQKPHSEGNEYKILFFPKEGFTEDIAASFCGVKQFGLYSLDRRLIKEVFTEFIPKEVVSNNRYLSNNINIENKKKELRAFWVDVLKKIKLNRHIDAVMTGNFSFAVEQEMTAALEETGIPVIALHKECLNTPRLEEFYKDVYVSRKNPFLGSIICVYNESERRIQKAARVTDPQNIVITGMPRLDFIHKQRRSSISSLMANSNISRPIVLFFSFNPKTGFPVISFRDQKKGDIVCEKLERELDELSVPMLTDACHHAMVNLAIKNPDIEVIIKTKANAETFINIENIYGKQFAPPDNFKFVHGGDPFDLILKSTVVCGFNSTTLLEAIALNKPVITPRFYETLDKKIRPYIIDLRSAVQYADSPQDLIKKILTECEASAVDKYEYRLDRDQIHVLDEYTGNSDGKAGERVRNVVIDLITKRKQN